MKNSDIIDAANRAVAAAGGPKALKGALGTSFSAITQWKQRGIPATRVLEIEKLTGISRHELRPDVFGVAS
jgi:DNA-binding transcriptional regulator YdaS (Cro superfamily)